MRSTAQTEPKATRGMIDYLPTKLPQPLDVTKHADQFTSGIPDVTIAWQGFTTWLECKMLKSGKSLDSELGDDQLLYCRRLEGATNKRCWVLVWDLRSDPPVTRILRPSDIVASRRLGTELVPFMHATGINHKLVYDLIVRTHRFGWDR